MDVDSEHHIHGEDTFFRQYRKNLLQLFSTLQNRCDDVANGLSQDAQQETVSSSYPFVTVDLIHDENTRGCLESIVYPLVFGQIQTYRQRVGLDAEAAVYYPRLRFMDDYVTSREFLNTSLIVGNSYVTGAVSVSTSRLLEAFSNARTIHECEHVLNGIAALYAGHLYEVNRIFAQVDPYTLKIGSMEIFSKKPMIVFPQEGDIRDFVYSVNSFAIDGIVYPYQRQTGISPQESTDFTDLEITDDVLVRQAYEWLEYVELQEDSGYCDNIRYSEYILQHPEKTRIQDYTVLAPVLISDRSVLEGMMTIVVDSEGFLKPVIFKDQKPDTDVEYTKHIFDFLAFLEPRFIRAVQTYVKHPLSFIEAAQQEDLIPSVQKYCMDLQRIWNNPFPEENKYALQSIYETLQSEIASIALRH